MTKLRSETMELKMELFVFVLLLSVLSLVNAKPEARNKPDKRKQTKTNRVADKVKTSSGEFVFPDELEFDFSVDGEYEVHAMSRKMAHHKDMPTYDSAGRKQERSRKNQELYTDDNGAYQVSASKKDDGSIETDVKALYRNGKGEKCFYARQESHCWNIESKGEYKYMTYEGDTREVPPEISDKHKKRNVSPLIFSDFNPSRILKVVYVVDQAFMTWFRDLNNGDEAQTIEDAEDFIYMMNNEVTYMYRSIKEVSEASDSIPDMDIVVYAKGFYYPAVSTEWIWLSPYISNKSIDVYAGINAFGEWVGDGNIDATGQYDTATFLSTRELQSSRSGNIISGFASVGSVCKPGKRDDRVSMNWVGYTDVAWIVAHELGHSLNSYHDGNRAGINCKNARHIMSTGPFRIDNTTKDTWNRLSTCSVSQIINHVNTYSGCLLDGNISDDDFYDQLCRGARGTNQFDVDYQCKSVRKLQSSKACSPSSTVSTGKVSTQACWDNFQVQCTNATGACSDPIFTIFDGTPCDGTDSSRDYICFRGDCLEKVDVCAGRSNDSTTSAPGTTKVTEKTDSTSGTTTTTVGVTVSSSPFPTTRAAECSCRGIRRRRRRARCCRNQRTNEGTCCRGCRPNRRGTNCIPRRR